MIKNRLAELLAERQLKITKVAKDTGISRNTITATSQNDGSMIKLDTIDTLCNYLGVTPADFFEFVPATFDISTIETSFDLDYSKSYAVSLVHINSISYCSDIYLDVIFKKKSYSFSLECKTTEFNANILKADITFCNEEDKTLFQELKTNIGKYLFESTISDSLENEVKSNIINLLKGYRDEVIEESDLDIFLIDFKIFLNIPDEIFLPF